MSSWVVTWQVGSTDVQIHVSRSQLLKMMEHNSRKVRRHTYQSLQTV